MKFARSELTVAVWSRALEPPRDGSTSPVPAGSTRWGRSTPCLGVLLPDRCSSGEVVVLAVEVDGPVLLPVVRDTLAWAERARLHLAEHDAAEAWAEQNQDPAQAH